MYEYCLGSSHSLKYVKYFFGKDKLTLVRERCSNHAMRGLDDLGSHYIDFTFKELGKYWSLYAKGLFSDSGHPVHQEGIQNKLYKGKINQYPIILLVQNVYEDGSFSAVYWYEKRKKLIEWNGVIKDNHISITENDYHSEELKAWIPRAIIEAEVKGNRINGTWQDYKTKKYLNLELEEL